MQAIELTLHDIYRFFFFGMLTVYLISLQLIFEHGFIESGISQVYQRRDNALQVSNW